MNTTRDLPKWRMVSDADGHFSWSPGHGDVESLPAKPRRIAIPRSGDPALPRIPSMADLLLQAPPQLLAGRGGGESGAVPMFTTGSGRSVSVRQSSVQKAAFVLGGPDGSGSMFKTGSGRSVSVRESSIQKVASLFGESEKSERGCGSLNVVYAGDEGPPMFFAGSGKSVTMNKSSLNKAASVLKGDIMEREIIIGCGEDGAPMFQTGLGKTMGVKQSSLVKASFVLQEKENPEIDMVERQNQSGGLKFSGSFFQTGSGKTVNISPAGVRRATALLGLDENHDPIAPCIKHMMDRASIDIENGSERSCHLERLSMNSGSVGMPFGDPGCVRPVHRNSSYVLRDQMEKAEPLNLHASDMHTSASMKPTIRFHTAGGKSLSISDDALRRARSLLGDLDSGIEQHDSTADYLFSSVTKETSYENSWNKENFHCLDMDSEGLNLLQISLGGSLCTRDHLIGIPKTTISSGNQVNKKDFASKGIYKSKSRTEPEGRLLGKPFVDISNKISSGIPSQMHLSLEKKRHTRTSSISPFKRPRMSRFSTPLNENISLAAPGESASSVSKDSPQNIKMSARFPCQPNRKSILEFFGGPPTCQNSVYGAFPLVHLSDQVRHMNPDKAAIYRFTGSSSLEGIGADNLQHMLIQSGASLLQATKEWVQNHYKWIVWKLACLERSYPQQTRGKYLTVANVLEELKHRYEREVNHGHRSAVKKILEGDASPASMVVLCVSAIYALSDNRICKVDDPNTECEETEKLRCYDGHKSSHAMKIELTDGWYSLNATLDGALSEHLMAGKLFVGQKLRIWGAALCGWDGPVSPLEACEVVNLQLHINGTYRAHWAERLGFCRGFKFPLAFRCIKAAGGPIPKALIGITRIYPILYKERFPDGGSIVRSERMESKMLHLYNQRRFLVAEGIISEQDKDITENDNDNDEGAKIFKILEMSAEPELLMADMTSEQLMSFSNYQAKQEAIRQDNVHKKIEKAFEDAGLSSREVSPFMRVRVVGLTRKGSFRKCFSPRQGLITIWNPTEKQKVDLVEGKIYLVSGLMPLSCGSDIIYLQARGSASIWKPLSLTASEKFETFFSPRCSVLLSTLGEVPLSGEFDIAAVILYVGDVFVTGHQKKQWVFMTDGSQAGSELQQEGMCNCLLAVNFCLPVIDKDMSPLVNPTLLGSTVSV
ncbi:hypothetical protein Taro_009393 [Colocasia esculenta]|uniref:Tower domain-containing protein n=1 Tax=Colocasia esculenta TaxID=4460 RepID=A0A843U4M1_COLES|nr:hypothetical protein [Colocasia esculenta]